MRSIYNTDMQTYLFLPQNSNRTCYPWQICFKVRNEFVGFCTVIDGHVFLFLTLTRSMIFGSLEINLDTRNKSNEDMQHFPNPIAIPSTMVCLPTPWLPRQHSPNPMATSAFLMNNLLYSMFYSLHKMSSTSWKPKLSLIGAFSRIYPLWQLN